MRGRRHINASAEKSSILSSIFNECYLDMRRSRRFVEDEESLKEFTCSSSSRLVEYGKLPEQIVELPKGVGCYLKSQVNVGNQSLACDDADKWHVHFLPERAGKERLNQSLILTSFCGSRHAAH